MKHSIEEIANYIEQWRDTESYSDFNLALDKGLIEYACYIIHSAGAIDSKHCYEQAKAMEKSIERLVKTYTNTQRTKDVKELLNGVEVWIFEQTNEHWFIDRDIHIGADSAAELRANGFISDKEQLIKDLMRVA